jgi:tetratricopeptide (TPR) repeat protein
MATSRARRARIRPLLVALLALAPLSARGGQPLNITPAEMALIPPYCADAATFGSGDAYYNTSPGAAKWVAMMGKGFWAIHHYCWALINLSRIQRPSTPPVIRQGTREAALSDMKYVIDNTTPNFVVLPEIYTRMGEVQLALDRDAEAYASFSKARQLKPDYWPAYYQWADDLRRKGRKDQAREVVQEGLRHAPQSKSLLQLRADLGAAARSRPKGDQARDGGSGASVQ